MLDKYAKSSDFAQQQLREHKAKFNKQVKLLVAYLQGLKRGISGRGDAKFQIPASNIKDPLPSEINSIIGQLASHYTAAIESASQIVNEQASYSQNRRKPHTQDNAQQSKIASALIAEGSWAGSRTYARLSLLKKISRKERRLRLDMLGVLLDIYRSFKLLETHIVDYKNPNSVPEAISKISQISSEYISVFIRLFNKIQELYIIQEETAIQTEQDAKPKKEMTILPVSEEEIQEFKFIDNQIIEVERVINTLSSPENVEKYNSNRFGNLKKIYMDFKKHFAKASILFKTHLKPDDDEVEYKTNLATRVRSVIKQYKQMTKAVAIILEMPEESSNFTTFRDKIIPLPVEVPPPPDVELQFEKDAAPRWLNKMMLSINPSNLDKMKLEIVENIKRLKKNIDSLMNDVEDRNKTISIDNVSQNFVNLIDQILELANNYMIHQNTEKRYKRHLAEIRSSDLAILKDLKRQIIGNK